MTKRFAAIMAAAAAFAAAGALWAQADAEGRKPRRGKPSPAEAESPPSAPPEASGSEPSASSSGADKRALETYVKQRLAAIEQAHAARMDFMTRESAAWAEFWAKVKDDRRRFEIGVARQRLDFFDQMASLDPQTYGGAVADFEKMQGNVMKTFEIQQKQRMDDFFARRDARWKVFALQQEKDRADFVSQADASWQTQKSNLKASGPAAPDGRK